MVRYKLVAQAEDLEADDNQPTGSDSDENASKASDNTMDVYLSVRTTSEFRNRLKLYAIQADISLQELVNTALEQYLLDNPSDR
jgi:hypothetical protein